MTLSVTHTFQSAKGDPPDTTLVRPSNWNAEHTITMAADKVIGRSGTSGAAQELSFTAFAQTLAACADVTAVLAALGLTDLIPTTGDIKMTLKTTADSGWILMNDGTIGDASSAASTRANADCEDLFTLLWNNVSDTYAPVTGGRGANAAADWSVHNKIALAKVLGRALAAAGSGSGLSARTLGQTAGEETHTLTESEMPSHNHGVTDPQHHHGFNGGASSVWGVGGGTGIQGAGGTTAFAITLTDNAATGITINDAGSDAAHNNVQPTSFLNVMIKL